MGLGKSTHVFKAPFSRCLGQHLPLAALQSVSTDPKTTQTSHFHLQLHSPLEKNATTSQQQGLGIALGAQILRSSAHQALLQAVPSHSPKAGVAAPN